MSGSPDLPPPLPRVLLIGGSPMSGKTSTARALARLLDRVVVSTDDLGEAARAVTPPAAHRALHAYAHADMQAYYAGTPPDVLVEDARRAHVALWPAVEAVVRAHAAWASPAVIEGWAVLPDLVVRLPRETAACVWIGVPDDVLAARAGTDTDFLPAGPDRERAQAHFVARNVAFQRWVRERAAAVGVPWIDADGDESADGVAHRCLAALRRA